jgi:hypothetical protein
MPGKQSDRNFILFWKKMKKNEKLLRMMFLVSVCFVGMDLLLSPGFAPSRTLTNFSLPRI